MDTGPSYSYQHDLKTAQLVISKGKRVCVVQPLHSLLCFFNS